MVWLRVSKLNLENFDNSYKYFFWSYLVFLVQIVCFIPGSSASDHDVSMKIFHNYDIETENFVDCGKHNFYFGNAEIKDHCLSPEVRYYIKENSHIDHAHYRIIVVLDILGKTHEFQTFIPFIQLVQTNFQYSFKITVDDNLTPLAITAKAQNSTKNQLGDNQYVEVFFRHMSQGPQPDTATFIHKMEREREAKEKGANQDNRSFIAKYWIYILPLLIFAVLSGSVNADGNGPQR